jgi:hypothetical protein
MKEFLASCKNAVTKDECTEACDSFQDTIGNGHNFSDVVVPNGIKMDEDAMPICKGEVKKCPKCGKSECTCGKNECSCSEAYFIDGRLLDIYMSDNDISNDAVAVGNICEHYGIDIDDVYVVVECDEVNKGLIDHTKHYLSCGLLRRCDNQIRNCINAGIKVVKRS